MLFHKIISFFLAFTTFLGYVFNFQKPLKENDYKISTQEVVRDMDKYVGIHSEIKNCGGVPTLYINGEPHAAVAYMTYLEKFNEYDDFAAAGYKFFSVPVLFSGRWISITDGLTPFKKGIFDVKDALFECLIAILPGVISRLRFVGANQFFSCINDPAVEFKNRISTILDAGGKFANRRIKTDTYQRIIFLHCQRKFFHKSHIRPPIFSS